MRIKVSFVYEEEGEYKIESLWTIKTDEYYKVDNIPFFIKNVSLGDIVSVEDDDGELFFDDIIETSGHSTIQIVFFDQSKAESIEKSLEERGCHWEGSHIKSLISVDIPSEVNYEPIKKFLDDLESLKILEYREACLGQN